MIDLSSTCLLMIEPTSNTSAMPVIDQLTRRMTAALNGARKGVSYRGFHQAKSGACSANCELFVRLRDGREVLTHSLAVHYLAYSRGEIPESELAKLALLPEVEAEPTPEQLAAPSAKRAPRTDRPAHRGGSVQAEPADWVIEVPDMLGGASQWFRAGSVVGSAADAQGFASEEEAKSLASTIKTWTRVVRRPAARAEAGPQVPAGCIGA